METNLEVRVMLSGQVHQDLLKALYNAKNDFLEVRGSGKYFWPNLIKWWKFNGVIRSWKKAWDYDNEALDIISDTQSPECMVEPVNEMNDLLVNYKSDIVGVLSFAYGKDVAIDFFNIYSFGGRI
ncbi:hypothetical protein pETSU_152 [Edwardsiella phage pEt-SU]|uniref:Uncharacterized protein n=1 Tax=Edwardsiella phage pEt-SU TaxID=2562142 RepID=A0A4D6DWM7_9CAUD|nr:hypothetical protein HOV39_gp152 [Edwardsiella phage pEt-SU]QBZ70733.1 hypothetical protein pETSU_152 [Edwardsiella phage pEt-SU]